MLEIWLFRKFSSRWFLKSTIHELHLYLYGLFLGGLFGKHYRTLLGNLPVSGLSSQISDFDSFHCAGYIKQIISELFVLTISFVVYVVSHVDSENVKGNTMPRPTMIFKWGWCEKCGIFRQTPKFCFQYKYPEIIIFISHPNHFGTVWAIGFASTTLRDLSCLYKFQGQSSYLV